MKRILAMAISVILVASMAITGSIAYLQDSDGRANVMTLGKVDIVQHEYERAVNTNGEYKTVYSDDYKADSYELQKFTQNKPLYPIVNLAGENMTWDNTLVYFDQLSENASGGSRVFGSEIKNVQDKFILVENTGKSDAFVRTFLAFELGSVAEDELFYNSATDTGLILTNFNYAWGWTDIGAVEINGSNFYVVECIYEGNSPSYPHANGVLPSGAYTSNSLGQIYMKSHATNEDCEALDGNGNGTYDILTLSQAVQVNGFEEKGAKFALDTAFGAPDAKPAGSDLTNAQIWLGALEMPSITSYEGVNYITEGDTVSAISNGGDTIYRYRISDGYSTAKNVVIGEGITTLGNRSLAKAPTFTTVTLPSTLTTIEESAFQQSNFTSIEIPENVTTIGGDAFNACGELETLIIKAKDVTFKTNPDGNMFTARACAKLKDVYIYSDNVTFEGKNMPFTNEESNNKSNITIYVKNETIANTVLDAYNYTNSGMVIKSLDGNTTFFPVTNP